MGGPGKYTRTAKKKGAREGAVRMFIISLVFPIACAPLKPNPTSNAESVLGGGAEFAQ